MNFSKQPCYDILEATCVTRIAENAVIGSMICDQYSNKTNQQHRIPSSDCAYDPYRAALLCAMLC